MTDSTHSALHRWLHETTGRTFSRWHKLLLLAATLMSAGIAYAAISTLGAIPIRGYSPSLLQHGSPGRTIVALVATIAAGLLASTLIAGRVRPDAGIFCVAVSLLVFRFYGRSTRYTLLEADGARGLLLMAGELALLGGLLIAAYAVIHRLIATGTLPDETSTDGCRLEPEKLDQRLLCTLTVAVVMTVGMMILCQSSDSGQAVWAVLLSALGASWCAFRFIPVAPAVWYWSGPLLCGVVGYLYTFQFGGQTANIGLPRALLGAVSRPSPLDFASVGVAGAMLGYWIGRRQKHHRDDQSEATAAAGTNRSTG